jgi:hypothetical protein
MHLVVYLPLLLPVLAAVAARPLAERLPPAAATWLLAGSAVALAAASSAMLGLLALTVLIRLPVAADLGHWSLRVVGAGDPVSLPVANRRRAAGDRGHDGCPGAMAPRRRAGRGGPGCAPPARRRAGRGRRRRSR